MKDEQRLNRFGVVGKPISHSLSPEIHQSFASQFNLAMDYQRFEVDKPDFITFTNDFFQSGGRGLNVTTPYKTLAAEIVNKSSDVAKVCQSVNTLWMDDKTGLLAGDSTDGIGWLDDLKLKKIKLEDARVLIIGAGGVARVLVYQLDKINYKSLHICNRTEHKAEMLAKGRATFSGLTDVPVNKWDLIVNTLSSGWQSNYPELSVKISDKTRAYDLNYGKGAIAFKDWFITSGGNSERFYDGWGMLVGQAAESFRLWWGKTPDMKTLIQRGLL